MIDLVWGSERDRFPDLFDAIFRLRHQIFKERLAWDVKSVNGRETDEFDDCNPAFFVSRNGNDEVDACWRLLPTTGPNMLRDTFPYLMGHDPVPAAPHIWEASRFAVSTRILDSNNLASLNCVTAELLCGMFEFGTANGMHELVTVCDVAVMRLVQRMGFTPIWKSRPQRIGNTVTIVVGYEISERVLAFARDKYGLQRGILRVPGTSQAREVA